VSVRVLRFISRRRDCSAPHTRNASQSHGPIFESKTLPVGKLQLLLQDPRERRQSAQGVGLAQRELDILKGEL